MKIEIWSRCYRE